MLQLTREGHPPNISIFQFCGNFIAIDGIRLLKSHLKIVFCLFRQHLRCILKIRPCKAHFIPSPTVSFSIFPALVIIWLLTLFTHIKTLLWHLAFYGFYIYIFRLSMALKDRIRKFATQMAPLFKNDLKKIRFKCFLLLCVCTQWIEFYVTIKCGKCKFISCVH